MNRAQYNKQSMHAMLCYSNAIDIKDPCSKSRFWGGGVGVLRQISHKTVLGIRVNIPTKACCAQMCFLLICNESCFYTFGRID